MGNADNSGSLTPRERDVAGLVAQGLTNREIGQRLDMAEGTVKTRVALLLLKLRAHNRAHIAAIAVRRGMA